MNDMMLQATRLTRANRLIEATALIQRMLRGETDSEFARLENRPPIIDGYAETIDETKPPHFNAAPFAKPHYFQTLRDPTYRFKYPSNHRRQGWMARSADYHRATDRASASPEGDTGAAASAPRARRPGTFQIRAERTETPRRHSYQQQERGRAIANPRGAHA